MKNLEKVLEHQEKELVELEEFASLEHETVLGIEEQLVAELASLRASFHEQTQRMQEDQEQLCGVGAALEERDQEVHTYTHLSAMESVCRFGCD